VGRARKKKAQRNQVQKNEKEDRNATLGPRKCGKEIEKHNGKKRKINSGDFKRNKDAASEIAKD